MALSRSDFLPLSPTADPPLPYPRDAFTAEAGLAALIERVRYKAGWRFELRSGWLCISIATPDSISGFPTTICHRMAVPQWPMAERDLRRWLFERICDIERHEAMEFFKVGGVAPYFPDHSGAGNPYAFVERD